MVYSRYGRGVIMHPILKAIAWSGGAIFAIAEVVDQAYDFQPVTLALLIIGILLILLALLLNEMKIFEQIKIMNSTIRLDTSPIRKDPPGQAFFFIVEIQFALTYGNAAINNEVEIVLPQDIKNRLLELTTIRNLCVYFQTIEEQRVIELRMRVPKTVKGVKLIAVKGDIEQTKIDKLDILSEEIETMEYDIKWKPAMGKQKLYQHKKGIK